MADYWEIAAHWDYDIFSWYQYLSVNLVFSHPSFLEWEFFSVPFLIIAYLYFFSKAY